MEADSQASSQPPETPVPKLHVHEWLAVVAAIGFLILLALVALFRNDSEAHLTKNEGKLHFLKSQTVDLYIAGAVAKPGSYRVKTGSFVKDAIAMAEPLPEADLRKIRPASKVRNGQSYVIPLRPMITLSLTGAVKEEGLHTVPKGTRLCELARHIALNPDADLEKLDRKRILKDNENFCIPVKVK